MTPYGEMLRLIPAVDASLCFKTLMFMTGIAAIVLAFDDWNRRFVFGRADYLALVRGQLGVARGEANE